MHRSGGCFQAFDITLDDDRASVLASAAGGAPPSTSVTQFAISARNPCSAALPSPTNSPSTMS